jgi:tRNA A-37 threonylcarbamoyl transferase component Bud32/dipeptidyl aminopeptidase/acylaminoacyl peptidase
MNARLNAALSDRYTITRELGAGGMATVYLAEDLKHDRKVAIKVLRPELAAIIGAERFLSEIKTTANLQHPHILSLFDSGQVDGTVFYVMPFVDGESLRDRVTREKQLPIDDAVRIAHEVADALQYAHQHGVIHRDIKPENILLHGGHALVADFGIALAASKTGGTRMTETGMSLGTPHYMSPEQAMGERDLDARTDIYALGCVTYEMLTGEPPFSGTTAQAVVARVLTETPRPIGLQRRTVPPHVEAAVLKALEKLPADRFGSAAEFDRALTTIGSGTGPVAKARSRLDWRAALVAGAVLGAAAFWLFTRGSHAAPQDVAGQRHQLTFNGRSWQPAISPDGDFVAYIDNDCKHENIDPCQATLMVQESSSGRAVPALSGALQLTAPRWSHDGATLVVAGRLDSTRSGLFAVPRLGGAPRSLGAGAVFDTHPLGDTVIVVQPRPGRNAEALFISLTSGTVVDSVALPFRDALDISWSPNGRFLAVNTRRRIVIVGRDGKETGALELEGRATLRWNARGDAVLEFRAAPVKEDDLVTIAVGPNGQITGAPEVVMARVPTLYLGQFDVARRTGRLILATGDAIDDIWTVNLTPGNATAAQRTRGTTWYGRPTISPDGSTLNYFRGDALGDNVYSLSLKTGVEEALTAQRRPGSDVVHFSADGRRLVYGHGTETGRLVEVLGLPSRTVATHDSPTNTSNIWPIGDRGFLDAGGDLKTLMVLDSLAGAWRTVPLPDSLTIVSFAPSPDSKRAAFLAAIPDGTMLFGTVPFVGGAVNLSARFPREPGRPNLTWDRDGTIYMSRWLAADENPSLWTVAEATGAAKRFATLSAHCDPESVFIAGATHTAVCLVFDYRSDVWIIDGVGGKR